MVCGVWMPLTAGTLQSFSSLMAEKENELQKVQDDGEKLVEHLALQKQQLESQNGQALSYQRSFHDSFEKVLKKQKCSSPPDDYLF